MLILAIVLFLIAVTLGLIILTAILQDRMPNKTARTFHGIFAAIGLLIVFVYVIGYMSSWSPLLIVSLVLLTLAALGGLTLFTLDLKKKKVPKFLAILHPIVAVAGLLALVIHVLP